MRSQYVTNVGLQPDDIMYIAIVVIAGIVVMHFIQDEHNAWLDRREARHAEKLKAERQQFFAEGMVRSIIDEAVAPPKRGRWRRFRDRFHFRGVKGPIEDASDDTVEDVWDSLAETGAEYVERTNPPTIPDDVEAVDRYMAGDDDEIEPFWLSGDRLVPNPDDPSTWRSWEEVRAEQRSRGEVSLPTGAEVEIEPRYRVRGMTLHTVECHHVQPSPRRSSFTAVPVDPTFDDQTVMLWQIAQGIRLCGICKPLEGVVVDREGLD